jgi:hypothetical protein
LFAFNWYKKVLCQTEKNNGGVGIIDTTNRCIDRIQREILENQDTLGSLEQNFSSVTCEEYKCWGSEIKR